MNRITACLALLIAGTLAGATAPPQFPVQERVARPPQAPALKVICPCGPGCQCNEGAGCQCPAQALPLKLITVEEPAEPVPVSTTEDCSKVYAHPKTGRLWHFTQPDGSRWEYLPELSAVPFASVPYAATGAGGFVAPNFAPSREGVFRSGFARGGSC